MDRPALMGIVVVFLLVLLVLMALGWRARRARQGGVARPVPVPDDRGAEIASFRGRYVATTAADDPLDRIVVHGLGFRSLATVHVAVGGLLIERPGNDDLWIPRDDLIDVRRATWTIDRVVERDGLDLVAWNLGSAPVDSYFRMDDSSAFALAVKRGETTI